LVGCDGVHRLFNPAPSVAPLLRQYLRIVAQFLYPTRLVQDASRYVQHMQKALTLMNVQLANVVSDVAGVTGQAIIRTILRAYDFVQKQMGECDQQLEKYMAVLPSRTWPGSDTQKAEDAGKKKRKDKKPKGNQPHFDLKAELQRVNGVDLTTIEGIDVMTA
jgi:transposase